MKSNPTTIDPNYRPSDRVYELLESREPRFKDNHEFIDHQIPGFIIYWEETGQKKRSWGMTFINWVMRNWENDRHKRSDSPTGGFKQINEAMGQLMSPKPIPKPERRYRIKTREEDMEDFKQREQEILK